RVLLSSQIPADFLKIQGFVSLLDSVFVGRLDDESAQADALRLLKVPVGAGYEQVVASLGRRPGGQRGQTQRDRAPRQFIFADGAGGVERIRVDLSGEHLEHLRAAMDTTPDAMRDAGPADPSQQAALPPSAELEPPPGEQYQPELEEELAAEWELGLSDVPPSGTPPVNGRDDEAPVADRSGRDSATEDATTWS
ncbi:MAG: ATP-binding protein, partial [Sciscionella sp.]